MTIVYFSDYENYNNFFVIDSFYLKRGQIPFST